MGRRQTLLHWNDGFAGPHHLKNRLFVGEGDHEMSRARIYAFDLKSGELLGAFQTAGHTEGTPSLVHDADTGLDHLLFTAGRDGVYSIDPVTLKEQWHFVGGHSDGDPRVRNGRVYVATGVEKGVSNSRHRAYALDLKTGEKIWSAELPASGWMPAVFAGNEVCFGVGEIYWNSPLGQLSCYDRETGRPGPTWNRTAPVLSIPLRVGNQVVVADRDGQVCSYRLPQVSQGWCYSTHGAAAASVTYVEPGALLYPSATGGLLAFEPEGGRLLASWKPTQAEGAWKKTQARATLAAGGGSIFLTDSDGSLRKIAMQIETVAGLHARLND